MIKYSVIIPVYNMQRYLGKCVESVLSQRRKDVEIILVNDGSIDESLSICRYYETKGNVVVIDKENSGSMDSWIQGLLKASGVYVCFVDSDDMIVSNYFDVLDSILLKSDYDIIAFDYFKMFRDNVQKVKVNNVEYGLYSAEAFESIQNNYFANYQKYSFYRWNKLFKREILVEAIKDINVRTVYFEDLFIGLTSLRIAKNCYYLDEALYFYRMRKTSVSHSYNEKVFFDNRAMKEALKEWMGKNGYGYDAILCMSEYLDYGFVRTALRCKRTNVKIPILKEYLRDKRFQSHKRLFLLYKYNLSWLFRILWMVKKKSKNVERFFE